MTLVACFDLKLQQIDVKTIVLNGDIVVTSIIDGEYIA